MQRPWCSRANCTKCSALLSSRHRARPSWKNDSPAANQSQSEPVITANHSHPELTIANHSQIRANQRQPGPASSRHSAAFKAGGRRAFVQRALEGCAPSDGTALSAPIRWWTSMSTASIRSAKLRNLNVRGRTVRAPRSGCGASSSPSSSLSAAPECRCQKVAEQKWRRGACKEETISFKHGKEDIYR